MRARYDIPLARHVVEELNAVKQVFESGLLTGGDATAKFEYRLARYPGCRYALVTSSCYTALDLPLLKSGVGSRPVTIDTDTFNMEPAEIEDAVTDNARGIIPVHLLGLATVMNPILKIAGKSIDSFPGQRFLELVGGPDRSA